jgi:transcriptional regulator with XRE-family HTH domain
VSIALNDWIREKLKVKRWSQRAACMYAELGDSTIHHILANPHRIPDVETLRKLAKVFGEQPAYVYQLAGYEMERPPITLTGLPSEWAAEMVRIMRLPPGPRSASLSALRTLVDAYEKALQTAATTDTGTPDAPPEDRSSAG